MNTGKSIKMALIGKGWSQKELAVKLGVTKETMSVLANRYTCSAQRLDDLAKIFEMKVSDFVALGESNDINNTGN